MQSLESQFLTQKVSTGASPAPCAVIKLEIIIPSRSPRAANGIHLSDTNP